MAKIPHVRQPIADNGTVTPPWQRFFSELAAAGVSTDTAALARALGSPDGTIAAIPASPIYGNDPITVYGTMADGLRVSLALLADSGAGTLRAITRDGYGRVSGSRLAVLDDLSDVTSVAPTTGYALLWNGTAWVPGAVAVAQTFNRIDDDGNPRKADDGALRKTD